VRRDGELVQWLLAILATIPKSGVESPQFKLARFERWLWQSPKKFYLFGRQRLAPKSAARP
jgi:hypothetical protein